MQIALHGTLSLFFRSSDATKIRNDKFGIEAKHFQPRTQRLIRKYLANAFAAHSILGGYLISISHCGRTSPITLFDRTEELIEYVSVFLHLKSPYHMITIYAIFKPHIRR